MAISFSELYEKTVEATKRLLDYNKDSSVVKFINKSIEKFSIIAKTIDEVLKRRNIDIKKVSIDYKNKAKEFLDKIKNKGAKVIEEVSLKEKISSGKKNLSELTSKFTSLFKKDSKEATGPPNEVIEKSKNVLNGNIVSRSANSLAYLLGSTVKGVYFNLLPLISKKTSSNIKKSLGLLFDGGIEFSKGIFRALFDNKENPNKEKNRSLLSRIGEFVFRTYKEFLPFASKKTSKGLKEFLPFVSKKTSKGLKEMLLGIAKGSFDLTKSFTKGLLGVKNKDTSNVDKKSSIANSIKDRIKATWEKYKERQEKRKKEIEEEKKAIAGKTGKKEDKKNDSWLDKLLDKIKWLGGIFLGVGTFIKKAFEESIESISKFFKDKLNSVTSFFKDKLGFSNKSNTDKNLPKNSVNKAAKSSFAEIGSKSLKFALSPMGSTVGRLTVNPVGKIVLGAAITSGIIYKGYKFINYLKLSKLKKGIYGKFLKLRLYTYGIDSIDSEYLNSIFDIEMILKDYVEFSNYNVLFKKLDDNVKEKIMDILRVNVKNTEERTNAEYWLMNRFFPAFKVHLEALYRVNNHIYFDTIDKLKWFDLFRVITNTRIPNIIYEVNRLPFPPGLKINVTKGNVDDLITYIISELKFRINNAKDIEAVKEIERKRVEEKKREYETKQIEYQSKEKQRSVYTPNKIKSKSIVETTETEDGIDVEKRVKKDAKEAKKDLNIKVNGRLNAATGKLVPGDTSLIGITTNLPKEKIFNLDSNVFELFTGMAKEYNSLTGKTIPVSEAFRTYEDQRRLYNKDSSKAAKPGTSTHEYGLAIDIDPETADELEKLGLLRKYGFTRPIGQEKWHLEPIGVSRDPVRAKSDIEYRIDSVISSPGKGGGGYGTLPYSVKKKRNINYQNEIYKKGSDVPIDLNKISTENLKKQNYKKKSSKEENGLTSSNRSSNSNYNLHSDKKSILDVVSNKNMDISRYSNLSPEQAIRQAAKMTGVNEDTLLKFAKLESSMNPDAKSNKTSAEGLFQILDSTWKDLVKRHGYKYGIPLDADKNNPLYNALMAAEYAKENISKLSEYRTIGIRDDVAMYLAHHYGLRGARNILEEYKNNPYADIRDVVSKEVYRANRSELSGNTVSSYIEKITQKLDKDYNNPIEDQVLSYIYDQPEYSYDRLLQEFDEDNTEQPLRKLHSYMYKQTPSRTYEDDNRNLPLKQNTELMKTLAQGIENILNEQLSTLQQIVTILTSIDNKINLEKIIEVLSNSKQDTTKKNNSQNNPFIVDRNMSRSGINLSNSKFAL